MSTFNNVNVLDSILAKELFYMPGDVEKVGGKFCGYLTGGNKDIYTTISLNKIIHSSVSSITAVDEGGITIRQNGGYLYGSGAQNTKWTDTISIVLLDNTVSVTLLSSTNLDGINNNPVGILFSNLVFYFH